MEYFISFLEGIITFLSPCLLPMLPLYLTYIAGNKSERSDKKTLTASFGFVTGFSITFILLGAFAGTLGRFLIRYRVLLNVFSGLIVIGFGLNYMGALSLKFLPSGSFLSRIKTGSGFFSAILFGIIFSIGWTPCVGVFLGSALVMAAQTGSALKGVTMLAFYCLGLGIPFVLSSVLMDQLKTSFQWVKKNYEKINMIAGWILILIGFAMMTGFYQNLMTALAS